MLADLMKLHSWTRPAHVYIDRFKAATSEVPAETLVQKRLSPPLSLRAHFLKHAPGVSEAHGRFSVQSDVSGRSSHFGQIHKQLQVRARPAAALSLGRVERPFAIASH